MTNMTIFKYPLNVVTEQFIVMPQGAKVLSIAEQKGRIQLWALVDELASQVRRRVVILGTGHSANSVSGLDFIGTFLLHEGALVFHAFVDPNPEI